MKACVRTASFFNDKMDDLGYTAKQRGAFGRLPRRECSTVLAPPSASLLKFAQNHSRLKFNTICTQALG